MNPDILRGISELESRRILSPETTALVRREESGERLSLYRECRGLLYLGVLLIVAGVGFLVKDNLDRIGPVAVAVGIGIAAAAALVWVSKKTPPFSWDEVPSPNLAFDYILLLGVLLASADLAYIESQFTPLGKNWPWHLLIVSIAMFLVSARHDSRVVFTLALTTFASWRSISAGDLEHVFGGRVSDYLRANMIGCGILFVLLGLYLDRTRRKAHFEPPAVHLGYFLILAAFVSGISESRGLERSLHGLALLATGVSLAYGSFSRRRFSLFAMGLCGSYWAVGWIITDLFSRLPSLMMLMFLVTAGAVVWSLLAAHRHMKEPL